MALKNQIREMHIVKEMTVPLFLCASFCALGGISFGIDYGYWSGMLGMAQFRKDFGVYDEATDSYILPASYQSGGSGPPMAGLALGALMSGMVGNRLGRIRTFQLSMSIGIIGILIQAVAFKQYWQLIAGRCINSFSLGIVSNAVPAYLAEVSPVNIRGTLVNFYQFSISVGGLLVVVCNWGTYRRSDQWAYRLAIIIQFVIPVVFLPLSFFVPESPRWLVGKGRCEEAEKSLRILRSGDDATVVSEETNLIVAQERENRARFSKSWVECFKSSNFRRTLICVGVQCLQQAQGSSFMASYRVIFLQELGFKDAYTLTILFKVTMILSSGLAFYFADRCGRRPILIANAFIMAVTMPIVTGIASYDLKSNMTAMKGALAVLFVWEVCLSFGWSSCVWIVTAETPSLQLREKTIMFATFIGFCTSILITFITPFIQAPDAGGLGSKIGFLFAGISFAGGVWSLLFLPETGSRSLEELDELFQNNVSVWRFKSYVTSGYGAQLASLETGAGVSKRMSVDATEERISVVDQQA